MLKWRPEHAAQNALLSVMVNTFVMPADFVSTWRVSLLDELCWVIASRRLPCRSMNAAQLKAAAARELIPAQPRAVFAAATHTTHAVYPMQRCACRSIA